MFILYFSLPNKDDSRICVNIQNKDGKEMNIQETKDNIERVNTQNCMYQNKFQKIALPSFIFNKTLFFNQKMDSVFMCF
jgi:hypothetical protein